LFAGASERREAAIATLGDVLANHTELLFRDDSIVIWIQFVDQPLNLLLVPSHLIADFDEIFLGDGAALVNIEQLENLSVDIVT